MPKQDQTDAPDFQALYFDLLRRQTELAERQAQALELQTERTAPKENPNYTANSPFIAPDGETWGTKLPFNCYLGSIHINETPITQAEMLAISALKPIAKAMVEKTDGSHVKASVAFKEDDFGRIERVVISLPMKKDDNPQHYPRLEQLAKQLTAQAELTAA